MKRIWSILLAFVLVFSVVDTHAARTGESSSSFTVAAGTAMAVSKSKTYRSITVQPGATLTVGVNGALTIQEELTVNGNLIVLGTVSVKKLSASSEATMTFLGTKAKVDVSTSAALNTANVMALAGAEKPINAASATGTDAAKALVRGNTTPGQGQDQGQSFGVKDYPTQITHTAVSNGRYVNWAGVSSVSQFADERGNFCFAVDEGSRVTVYKTQNGAVTGSVSINNPYDTFGAATCGNDGSLYMVWGRNNSTSDTSVPTIFVTKYTSEGGLISTAGGNGSEGMAYYYDSRFYTQTPFDAGNCDVAVNGDLLMVNYARHMYSGHQANTVFTVNTSKMSVEKGITSYNSHSFDQRVTPYSKTGGFLMTSQGDCFPRSFCTSLSSTNKTLNEMETFHFWVEKDAYKDYDMSKLNPTRSRLGNILETKYGAALVASSARSLSEAVYSEPYDVFVQVFDPTGDANTASSYVTSGTRSGLGGNNGDQNVTDYGVKWLTNLAGTGKTADVVQAVSAGDKIVVLYELNSGYSYDSTWCIVLNGDGSVAKEATSLGSVRLNVDEDPVYANGAVQWISNSGSSQLVLHMLSLG